MKLSTFSLLATGLALSGTTSFAAEGSELPLQVVNRARVEFDDNVNEEKSDEDSSVNLIEELEILFQANGENTFFGLRYLPSFIWYSDREDDDTDLHHSFDASLRHAFNPNTELNLKQVLRFAELPELVEDDVTIRQNNDYLYSSSHIGLGVRVNPRFGIDLEGRHEILSYDDSNVADRNDYDKTTGGANLNYFLSQLSTLSAEGRYSKADYEDEVRSFSSVQGGLGLNNQLTKTVNLNLRGGAEVREYDDVDIDDSTDPYVSAGLNLAPNDGTSINLGAGYSLAQSPVSRFVSQGRASVQAGISYDVTGRLTANLSGSYATGDFKEEDGVAAETATTDAREGTEDVLRLSARVTYEVNKSNYLEAGWQYVDLASEIREESEYTRNRASLGWKTVFK